MSRKGPKARPKGLNKYQRAAFRQGELRVGREEIQELLLMSRSADPDDRLQAASFLCPCHVRRSINAVWKALYRMLEDQDVRVRRAAWHTLEDGGKPDDPALNAIIERTLERETDKQVLNFAWLFSQGREKRKQVEFEVAAMPEYAERGKCDFCGARQVPVKRDFATELNVGGARRFALVCAPCDRAA